MNVVVKTAAASLPVMVIGIPVLETWEALFLAVTLLALTVGVGDYLSALGDIIRGHFDTDAGTGVTLS
jgi:hypothetical protein